MVNEDTDFYKSIMLSIDVIALQKRLNIYRRKVATSASHLYEKLLTLSHDRSRRQTSVLERKTLLG